MTERADNSPEAWVADVRLERIGRLRRALKRYLLHPVGNYAPAWVLRGLLRLGGSELARETWADPGGWRSMVITYQDRRTRLADKVLCAFGTVPMALRNRRRLAARVLARLIDASPADPVEVLCLGAGPGHVIGDALAQARRTAHATLVDLSADACDYGRRLAESSGHGAKMRFILGDACHVDAMLDRPPHVVKMLGLCEYLPDERLAAIAHAVARVMPRGAAIVTNSLSDAHGTDRFFRRVLGLEMIHRTPEALEALLRPAGFGDFTSLAEPMGVYHVVIGRKG